MSEELLDIFRGIQRVFWRGYVPLVAVLTLIHYPNDTDPSLYPPQAATVTHSAAVNVPETSTANFYEAAYLGPDSNGVVPRRKGLDYESTAAEAATKYQITPRVADFVNTHQLKDKKVLEVGSGRGYLQDLVEDYTGLDLSPSVARHYHKKFVVGSATALPFPDNTFDAIWTVWVLEHIPEPEKAMREMRRVLKPGGKLFLMAAWNCKPWLADGFAVRPYSDFNWKGKLVKASLLLRDTAYLQTTYMLPTRFLRHLHYRWSGAATPLHFNKLQPNYAVYWQPDSDAAINVDGYEAYLWHRAQGDQCLNCGGAWEEMTNATGALILQVNK